MDSTKCSFNTTFRSDRNLGFFFSKQLTALSFSFNTSQTCACSNFQQSVFHKARSGSWRLEVHLKKTWAVQENSSFTGQTIMLNLRFTGRRQILFERKHHRPATTVRNKLIKLMTEVGQDGDWTHGFRIGAPTLYTTARHWATETPHRNHHIQLLLTAIACVSDSLSQDKFRSCVNASENVCENSRASIISKKNSFNEICWKTIASRFLHPEIVTIKFCFLHSNNENHKKTHVWRGQWSIETRKT